MDRHTVIFVTDKRQKHLAEYLGKKIETVSLNQALQSRFAEEVFSTAERVIYPTPTSKLWKAEPCTRKFNHYLNDKTLVFGGKIDEDLKRALKKHMCVWYDLMEDERVAMENAMITAEAVVAKVIENSLYSVCGQKILITGYGRCARQIAIKLAALGAVIVIVARSREARKDARADGFVATDFVYAPQETCSANTVINTVPACVITERLFREMQKDVLVIDIASAPGGCKLSAAEKYQIPVCVALGLPGIYTTKSSAKVLGDAIRRKTFSESGVKEEKSWIFQILVSDTV